MSGADAPAPGVDLKLRARCAAIVMHRFPQTPEEIAKSVAELDYKFISLQTMGELRNLFPAKTYEEEVKRSTISLF
jgi:hypothetical protein